MNPSSALIARLQDQAKGFVKSALDKTIDWAQPDAVMRKCLAMRDYQPIIRRCEYDTNGCAYFKTGGKKTLDVCNSDGHYRCKECVNLTVKL